MADEIYINIKNAQHSQEGNLGPEGTFQQAYQGQRPATGRLQVQRVVSGQTPFTYQNPYPFTYPASAQANYPFQQNYQNPYPYQQNYATTRSIGAATKVKAIYVNDQGTLRKLQEVYVNNQGTVEKIHQTIPVQQFNKA